MVKYSKIIILGMNNTCRSFMAEVVMHKLIKKNNLDDKMTVVSRGLTVLFPEPVNPKAAGIVREREYAITDFLSSMITEEEIEEADLILTITEEEKNQFLSGFEQGEGKTYTLNEFSGETKEIPDPYGKEMEVYEACFDCIQFLAQKAFERLK